jgi:hypothetical protein
MSSRIPQGMAAMLAAKLALERACAPETQAEFPAVMAKCISGYGYYVVTGKRLTYNGTDRSAEKG